MPKHNTENESHSVSEGALNVTPQILGFLDKERNRAVLIDPTEIGNYILSGGTMCHRFSTMEGASIWQNHGEIKHCDLNMENTEEQNGVTSQILGFLDKDGNRVALVDPAEIGKYMLSGRCTMCHRFSTMEGASIWQNHGEIKYSDLNMEKLKEQNDVTSQILGFLDKDGNRVALVDPTEIGNYILSGGTMCHRFSTMEGASIWQNHGEIKRCDPNMENAEEQNGVTSQILGFLDKDGNRVALVDPAEIGKYMLSGRCTVCHRFSSMEGASIWQNHGEIKHCDLNMENTKQQKGREDHSLEQAAEPSAQETDAALKVTTAILGCVDEAGSQTVLNAQGESQELPNSLPETDFNAPTIYFGVTTDDIRMIVRDLDVVEYHVKLGAKLHYSFPSTGRASFWEEHGIVRDHFFETYSVDQNTVGLHEVLTEGAERTVQAFKTQEKSKYASLSRPKADSNGPTVCFGLTHWEDPDCFLLLTDLHEIQAYVNRGSMVCYRFPTVERFLEFIEEEDTIQDGKIVEYSIIPNTAYLHDFLMKGVEKTAQIDLDVPPVYFGLKFLDSRFVLTDPNEFATFFKQGAQFCFAFKKKEAADYWKEHGTVREDDTVEELNPDDSGFECVLELYESIARNQWGDIPTCFFGVTHSENFRMIVSDPREIKAYLEHGASIDGLFANMKGASFWLEHGVIRDRFGFCSMILVENGISDIFVDMSKAAVKAFQEQKRNKKPWKFVKGASKGAAKGASRLMMRMGVGIMPNHSIT